MNIWHEDKRGGIFVDIERILDEGINRGASDIHLIKGNLPMLRINKELVPVENADALSQFDIEYAFRYFTGEDERLIENYKRERKLDINFEYNGNRLRVNISSSLDSYIFTIRIIKNTLPEFDELKLPSILKRIATLPQGLILVTGKSNSGKSTTLNALVNEINKTENKKILILESPIEYMHTSKKSLVVQKEVGVGKDCLKFSDGVTNALREDCDILVVGEIRDKDTMEATIEMAESGHLVIGTMHTRSCAETIDRILSFYDVPDQLSIKYILSSILKAVVAQRLIKGMSDELVMIPEIMIVDEVIGSLIRKEKFSTTEIEDAMQSRMDRGNLSLMNSLANAVIKGKITLIQAEKQIDETKYPLLTRTIRQLEK